MPPRLRKRPAPASNALPTNSQCRSELWRFARAQHCPETSTAKGAYRFLSAIGAYAELSQIFRPCTKSDGQACHLLYQLNTWNRLLQQTDMQIEEVAPETLSVTPWIRISDDVGTEHCKLDGWILLRWLFKEHHCIANIQMPSPGRCPRLPLCEVLCQNSGVKTLTLYSETSEENLRVIVSTASSRTKLEKLCIHGLTLSEDIVALLETTLDKLPSLRLLEIAFSSVAFPCNETVLQDAFKKMSTLATLALSYTGEPGDAELAFRCLGPSLSALEVDDRFLEPRGGAFFQEFLAGNTVLKKLVLYHKVCKGMGEVDNVFKGLLLNHGLEELDISNFRLNNPTMELLAEAVAGHDTLRVLKVVSFDTSWKMDGTPLASMLTRNKSLHKLFFSTGQAASYGAFADAVRKNSTLKELWLNYLVDLEDQAEISVYRGFLEALSCNDTIQQVTLGSICSALVIAFSELLQETGTERRVTFEVDMSDTELFIEALGKCTGLTQMRYLNWHCKIPVPPSALQHLIYYYRIKDLEISLWSQLIEGDAVTPLVQFIESTKTLKTLALAFLTRPASTLALLKGLSHNRTISSLHIHGWTFREHSANMLWQILKNSSTLNDIAIYGETKSDFEALRQFPERLLDNHSLLSASFESESKDSELKTEDIMRRNLSTLYRAVMFVMGSRGRHYVEAFERVSKSPALVKEVQKTASESEEDAKDRVRRTEAYLDQNFLVAVGVVKDVVMCEDNGQLQLDRIGLDNWLHIRQYLKVADIKDPADQPAMSRHSGKRHRSRR